MYFAMISIGRMRTRQNKNKKYMQTSHTAWSFYFLIHETEKQFSSTPEMASASPFVEASDVISDPCHTNCSSLTATFSFTMPSIF
jgi:hypothetical protein